MLEVDRENVNLPAAEAREYLLSKVATAVRDGKKVAVCVSLLSLDDVRTAAGNAPVLALDEVQAYLGHQGACVLYASDPSKVRDSPVMTSVNLVCTGVAILPYLNKATHRAQLDGRFVRLGRSVPGTLYYVHERVQHDGSRSRYRHRWAGPFLAPAGRPDYGCPPGFTDLVGGDLGEPGPGCGHRPQPPRIGTAGALTHRHHHVRRHRGGIRQASQVVDHIV